MKIVLNIVICLLLFSCGSSREITKNQMENLYRIKQIKVKNNWYIIYATQGKNLFKIISGVEGKQQDSCFEIKVGNYYSLDLKSKRENAPVINGVKLAPVNYLDIECFMYDEETEICIEPKKGIQDLYFSENLKGLCYLE